MTEAILKQKKIQVVEIVDFHDDSTVHCPEQEYKVTIIELFGRKVLVVSLRILFCVHCYLDLDLKPWHL